MENDSSWPISFENFRMGGQLCAVRAIRRYNFYCLQIIGRAMERRIVDSFGHHNIARRLELRRI